MSNVTSEDILKLSGGGRCSRINTIQKAWFPSLCGQSLLVWTGVKQGLSFLGPLSRKHQRSKSEKGSRQWLSILIFACNVCCLMFARNLFYLFALQVIGIVLTFSFMDLVGWKLRTTNDRWKKKVEIIFRLFGEAGWRNSCVVFVLADIWGYKKCVKITSSKKFWIKKLKPSWDKIAVWSADWGKRVRSQHLPRATREKTWNHWSAGKLRKFWMARSRFE